MKPNALDVSGLKVIYTGGQQTVHALNHVSFSLEEGETLCLVGETGAGKTTTALSIIRLLPESSGKVLEGRVLFDGHDLLALKESDMQAIRGGRISMIFQDPMTALNPVMPVGDQIIEALVYHNADKMSKKDLEMRVDEVMELVGIPSFRKKEYPQAP